MLLIVSSKFPRSHRSKGDSHEILVKGYRFKNIALFPKDADALVAYAQAKSLSFTVKGYLLYVSNYAV